MRRIKYSHSTKGEYRKLYMSWKGMVYRCYRKKDKSYPFYGAKGVKVCEEWLTDYQVFFDWSLESGWEEGKELDKDSKGDGFLYSPETCVWLTKAEHYKIKKKGLAEPARFPYKGEMLTVPEVVILTKMPRSCVWQRLAKRGWSVEKCIKTPYQNQYNNTY